MILRVSGVVSSCLCGVDRSGYRVAERRLAALCVRGADVVVQERLRARSPWLPPAAVADAKVAAMACVRAVLSPGPSSKVRSEQDLSLF